MSQAGKHFGSLGEHFAKGYFTRLGYKILKAPFRCRMGEIDLIGMDEDTVVFIEVKTRRSKRYGSPLEAIDRNKQRQIIKTARYYLCFIHRRPYRFCRFDVLGIVQGPQGTEPEVIHLKNAFQDDSGW